MKKRILTVALVVALLATCFGGTLAYLKDSEVQTNTFTTGNVLISLDEAIVEKNTEGNLVATGERTDKKQSYHLYPAMTVTKDPTITVDAESENAWVAAKVIISGAALYDLIPMNGSDDLIDINKIASGGLMGDAATAATWNGLAVHSINGCHVHQVADMANNTWTLYIFMEAEQSANAKIVLFDTLTIPAGWDNKEMALINGMNIEVQAFAVQVNGFADCYLDSYNTYIYRVGTDGEIHVWFDVMGTGDMDEIGVLSIELYEVSSTGQETWIKTFLHEDYASMLIYDDWCHASYVSYQGSTTKNYKAYVCIWAGKNGSGDTRYMWATMV